MIHLNDKIQHFLASLTIAFLSAVVMAVVGAGFMQCAMSGFMTSLAAGLGKEYGDSRAVGNKWDNQDLIADLAGAILGGVIAVVLYRLIVIC